MNPDKAVRNVQWALQEAYKMAVHMRGITDWSKMPNAETKVKEEKIVEEYQLKIAEMIIFSQFIDVKVRTT